MSKDTVAIIGFLLIVIPICILLIFGLSALTIVLIITFFEAQSIFWTLIAVITMGISIITGGILLNITKK